MRSKNETKFIILSILLIVWIIVCSIATLFMLVGTIVCLTDNSFQVGYVYLGVTVTLAIFFLLPAIIMLIAIKKKYKKNIILEKSEEDKSVGCISSNDISQNSDDTPNDDICSSQEEVIPNNESNSNTSVDKKTISVNPCSIDEMGKKSSPTHPDSQNNEKQKKRLIFKIWWLNNTFNQTNKYYFLFGFILIGFLLLVCLLSQNIGFKIAMSIVIFLFPLLIIVIALRINEKKFSKQFNNSSIEDLTIIYQNLKNEIYLKKKNNTGTYNTPVSIKDLSVLTPLEFEKYCAVFLMNNGYKNVKLTRTTGDFGADIIAKNPNGEMVACQCKYYAKPVGVKAIQEVFSSLPYYNCQKGIVFVVNGYTPAAKELARKTGVLLYDLGRNIAHDIKTKDSDWIEALEIIDDI